MAEYVDNYMLCRMEHMWEYMYNYIYYKDNLQSNAISNMSNNLVTANREIQNAKKRLYDCGKIINVQNNKIRHWRTKYTNHKCKSYINLTLESDTKSKRRNCRDCHSDTDQNDKQNCEPELKKHKCNKDKCEDEKAIILLKKLKNIQDIISIKDKIDVNDCL